MFGRGMRGVVAIRVQAAARARAPLWVMVTATPLVFADNTHGWHSDDQHPEHGIDHAHLPGFMGVDGMSHFSSV